MCQKEQLLQVCIVCNISVAVPFEYTTVYYYTLTKIITKKRKLVRASDVQ